MPWNHCSMLHLVTRNTFCGILISSSILLLQAAAQLSWHSFRASSIENYFLHLWQLLIHISWSSFKASRWDHIETLKHIFTITQHRQVLWKHWEQSIISDKKPSEAGMRSVKPNPSVLSADFAFLINYSQNPFISCLMVTAWFLWDN